MLEQKIYPFAGITFNSFRWDTMNIFGYLQNAFCNLQNVKFVLPLFGFVNITKIKIATIFAPGIIN